MKSLSKITTILVILTISDVYYLSLGVQVFPKCCPMNKVYNTTHTKSCQEIFNYSDTFWTDRDMGPEIRQLSCEFLREFPDIEVVERYRLQKDGSIQRYCKECPSCRKWLSLPNVNEFCIDGRIKVDSNGEFDFLGPQNGDYIAFCISPHNNVDKDKTRPYLYSGMLFVSAGFYFIVGLVYILLWDTHNIQGWTTFAMICSRFCMCVFLGISYTFVIYNHPSRSILCIAIGVIAHFFMLASFSWLAVLCFDIWCTFSSIKPRNNKSDNMRMFLYYSIVAITLPLLVLVVGLTLDFIYRHDNTKFPIPDYGNDSCFVSSCAKGPYILYEVGTCIIISFGFMIVTIFKLYKVRELTTAVLRSSNDLKGYILYGKLFLIMGFSWIFEILSWIAETGSWYWIVLDAFNLPISAILIFIILICKKIIVEKLEQKYSKFRVLSEFVTKRWKLLRKSDIPMEIKNTSSTLITCKSNFKMYCSVEDASNSKSNTHEEVSSK